MIEILIIIWVVRLFMSTATDKGYVRWQWGLYGALSYYGPILINSFFIAPILAEKGIIDVPLGGVAWQLVLMNLLVGAVCCFLTYQIFRQLPDKTDSNNTELLDN